MKLRTTYAREYSIQKCFWVLAAYVRTSSAAWWILDGHRFTTAIRFWDPALATRADHGSEWDSVHHLSDGRLVTGS